MQQVGETIYRRREICLKKKCLHMKRHQVDYQDSFLPGVNLYDFNSFYYFQVTVPAVRLSKEFIPSASKVSEKLLENS